MLDELTFEQIHPLIGSSFFADSGDGHRVEMRVVDVSKVMESQAARLKRTPFSISFVGPASYPLRQGTYVMQHDSFDQALAIFIVPIAERPEGFLYEAVFT